MALRNQVQHVVGVEIGPASVVRDEGNQLGNGGIFGGYGGGAGVLDIGEDSGTSENYLLHVTLKIGGRVCVARCVQSEYREVKEAKMFLLWGCGFIIFSNGIPYKKGSFLETSYLIRILFYF